jgi:hypothetical protein
MTAGFAPIYPLTVSKTGTGAGTVTSDVGGINCGTACAASSAPSTVVTLTAKPSAGSLFTGWSGGGCSEAYRICATTLNAAMSVTATFTANSNNVVFVSSQTYAGNLGGLAQADALCQGLANNAGLSGTFKAWLAAGTTTGQSRMGTARGWVRPDGSPFGDTLSGIVTSQQVLNPPALDENGALVSSAVWTGSDGAGSPFGMDCSGWTSPSASTNGATGTPTAGPALWLQGGNFMASCNSLLHLYCFSVDKNAALTYTHASGKRIWVSQETWVPSGGIAAAHSFCDAEKPAGVLVVKALLDTTSASATQFLTMSQTYVRPDGIVVGTGARIADPTSNLPSGIWQHADGTYVAGRVWTGNAGGIGSTCAAAMAHTCTCDNWQPTAGATGYFGHGGQTSSVWFTIASSAAMCTNPRGLYCVEQSPRPSPGTGAC